MTLLQSFDANFIVRVRLSKDLETDTLYLVFKDRIPNCPWMYYGQLELALSKRGY